MYNDDDKPKKYDWYEIWYHSFRPIEYFFIGFMISGFAAMVIALIIIFFKGL